MSKSLKYLIPFGIFIVLAGFLFKGLYMDPRQLPSVLINKPMPQWSLPTLFDTTKTLSTEEMKGKVWMLNVWATWCIPCKQEHPYMVSSRRTASRPRSLASSTRTIPAPPSTCCASRAILTTWSSSR